MSIGGRGGWDRQVGNTGGIMEADPGICQRGEKIANWSARAIRDESKQRLARRKFKSAKECSNISPSDHFPASEGGVAEWVKKQSGMKASTKRKLDYVKSCICHGGGASMFKLRT